MDHARCIFASTKCHLRENSIVAYRPAVCLKKSGVLLEYSPPFGLMLIVCDFYGLSQSLHDIHAVSK